MVNDETVADGKFWYNLRIISKIDHLEKLKPKVKYDDFSVRSNYIDFT